MKKSGSKTLCLAVIRLALYDGDVDFLNSEYSDLFFDLAELQRWKALKGFKGRKKPLMKSEKLRTAK